MVKLFSALVQKVARPDYDVIQEPTQPQGGNAQEVITMPNQVEEKTASDELILLKVMRDHAEQWMRTNYKKVDSEGFVLSHQHSTSKMLQKLWYELYLIEGKPQYGGWLRGAGIVLYGKDKYEYGNVDIPIPTGTQSAELKSLQVMLEVLNEYGIKADYCPGELD